MEEIIGDAGQTAKAVVFEDEQAGSSVPLLMTALDGSHNHALQESGYRTRNVIFAMIDGGVDKTFDDPHTVDHWAIGPEATEFMLEVKRGWQTYGKAGIDWTTIEDGSVIQLEDLEINEP